MHNEEQDKQENGDKRKTAMGAYARFSAIGFQMFVIIGAFTYAGYQIDNKHQSSGSLYTAFFSLAGVFIALFLVIRSIKKLKP